MAASSTSIERTSAIVEQPAAQPLETMAPYQETTSARHSLKHNMMARGQQGLYASKDSESKTQNCRVGVQNKSLN